MILPPLFVGAEKKQPKPLVPTIESDQLVLEKYGAVPMRVAQTLAVNAAQQWQNVSFVTGLLVGIGGVLLLQWFGTGIVGLVRDASDPTQIAEAAVEHMEKKKTGKKKGGKK